MEWVELKQFCDKQKPGNDLKTAAQRRKWVENTFGYELQKDLCWYTKLCAFALPVIHEAQVLASDCFDQ